MSTIELPPQVEELCELALKKGLHHGERIRMQELSADIMNLNGVSIEIKERDEPDFSALEAFAESHKQVFNPRYAGDPDIQKDKKNGR